MRVCRLFLPLMLLFSGCAISQNERPVYTGKTIDSMTKGAQAFEGYFKYWWNEKSGKILLQLNELETEFLYVNSLTAGVGSNDIGLDRGQLGGSRIVKFVRSGPKVLLLQPNYKFRAESDNPEERRSVAEAFASSVLWGFEIVGEENGKLLIDLTSFLMRDAHGVASRLKERKQGEYKIDTSRGMIYLPGTLNFPDNSEFESLLTFTGQAEGEYVSDVVPTPGAVSVRQHHSFVRLPDGDYRRRAYDPRCGYYPIRYKDYATPIDQPLVKRFIQRHRLRKRDPSAAVSEAVEPIVYYVDRGAPEPVRSALLEGARWWAQAFEAAGYRNAFRVEILPEGVHPLDIRYNLIQWVHRSTRGWSYGSSVVDPRSGEIIKGHVSLGSLRVRQDFLIAQGLIKAYETGQPVSPVMQQMALARLRQLSAHEVGHTLGLMHNFAASTNGRSSVMDYPHPLIRLGDDGTMDFDQVYDDQIGAWDIQAIKYGYQDFPEGTNEAKALEEIIRETNRKGLRYLSDQDARPPGSAHPYAHLWDNGKVAVNELGRLLKLRDRALQQFGQENLRPGAPLADLEEVLAPLYLMHRYQTEAVAKLIGGVHYAYVVRGEEALGSRPVLAELQEEAIAMMLRTLHPEVLVIPDHILPLIPPKPPDYSRGRESFASRMGAVFDPLTAAESAAEPTIMLLLHPQRAARLVGQQAANPRTPGLNTVLDRLMLASWKREKGSGQKAEIGRIVDQLVLKHLLGLAVNKQTLSQVNALAWLAIDQLEEWLEMEINKPLSKADQAHYSFALTTIRRFKKSPVSWEKPETVKLPDGSPIGMDWRCGGHFSH